MRFMNRSTPSLTSDEDLGTATRPSVVLRSGPKKVPVKAEKLLGSLPGDGEIERRRSVRIQYAQAPIDEDNAIKQFSRIQEELSSDEQGGMPWSPDSYGAPGKDILAEPDRLRREASDHENPPPAYTTGKQMKSQQTAESAVRDMALNKGTAAPPACESLRQTSSARSSPLEMKEHHASKRSSKTTGHNSSRTKKLDLVQLFPQPRPATGRLFSPTRQQHSPSVLSSSTDGPPPPPARAASRSDMRNAYANGSATSSIAPSSGASATAGKTGRGKGFDDEIFDQHKLNVRRPPKGIQNWFDAYLDTDDDDDDDDDEGGSEGEDIETNTQSEPQELPADEVLPPAYVPLSRDDSRDSQKDMHHGTPSANAVDGDHTAETIPEQDESQRYTADTSRSWDSIQSSNIGYSRQSTSESRVGSNVAAGHSGGSSSDSDYTDEDGEEEDLECAKDSTKATLPPIRDSIFDDRNVIIGSAAALGLHRLQRPLPIHDIQNINREKLRRVRSFAGDEPSQGSDQLSHLSTMQEDEDHEDPHDCGSSSVPADAAHMMAVTEEEMMLLDLMRRKRLAMQQMSFTEGYQLAMRTEQKRFTRRTNSAETRALKALRRQEDERRDSSMASADSPSPPRSGCDMRSQLSKIRKSQVDDAFQLERFLGMSQPQPLSSHPPTLFEEAHPEPPVRHPSGEILQPTVYSPIPSSTPSNANESPAVTQRSFTSSSAPSSNPDEIQRRVQHFIETRGAPPPLNSMSKVMRRNPASLPPSPIADAQTPDVPTKSPDRFRHGRNFSAGSQLTSKVSSVSLNDAVSTTRSPVSALPSRNNTVYEPSPRFYENVPPPIPAKAEKHAQASLERNSALLSNLTSSVVPPAKKSASPFTNIINAAAHPKPLSAATANWTPAGKARRIQVAATARAKASKESFATDSPASDIAVSPQVHVASETKSSPAQLRPPRPVCKLNTVEALDRNGSLLSITSAGEEVLAAWSELGGGPESLRTKRVRPSGPLSGLLNS